ncbi:hypothetical protein ABKN59_002448 [Abortiporus biennis]
MSRFNPSRASPLLKHSSVTSTKFDESRSSTLSVPPELAALTPDEIEFIDAVIERSPPSATTFLTVFKAYNDILHERGVDPQNEVLYYGKLLKLGTLKGKNWGDKWDTVKQQQPGYASRSTPTKPIRQSQPPPSKKTSQLPPRAQVLTRLTGTLQSLNRDDDVVTLHSHMDDTDGIGTTAVSDAQSIDAYHQHQTPRFTRRSASPAFTSTNTLGLNTGPSPHIATPRPKPAPYTSSAKRSKPIPSRTPGYWDTENSDVTTETGLSPIPPQSYESASRVIRSGQRETPVRTQMPTQTRSSLATRSTPTPSITAASAEEILSKARQRRGSVLNEEETWKKIQMEHDEKRADDYRELRLMERCWDVWKQGYQWITTTNEQIAQARDNLILRLAIHKWRNLTATRLEQYHRVAQLSNQRRMKLALHIWKSKFREKKQIEWRNDMRARMKKIRENRDRRLLEFVWTKWRQGHELHLADSRFSQNAVVRCWTIWKSKLASLDGLDATADMFLHEKEIGVVENFWRTWRHAASLKTAERTMSDRVALRIQAQYWDAWRNRCNQIELASHLQDKFIVQRAFRSWKAARDRIRAMNNHCTRHVGRQNVVYVAAFMRIWKAKATGQRLERLMAWRLVKEKFDVWKSRLGQQRQLEARAIQFSLKPSSQLAVATIQRWKQAYLNHGNAYTAAATHYSSRLQIHMLLAWRAKLRGTLKLERQARIAEQFFVENSAWRKWMHKLHEKRLQKKAKQFETRVLKKVFIEWHTTAIRQRELRLAEEIMRKRIALRLMSDSLKNWTNRVIDIKVRELEAKQKYDTELVTAAFTKWSNIFTRHKGEDRLMESYQFLKQRDELRRMFTHWLTAARSARRRRLTLAAKEDEFKTTVIAAAWDKWREKFQDRRLQPLADEFIIQQQKNLVFRAFGIWHSKSTSLPAVRFHASHTKAKVWKIWRDAMPNPHQCKQARDMYRQSLLSRAFDKWLQAYKVQIALKAVARARYLRLPTAAPRQNTSQPPRPIPPPKTGSAFRSALDRPRSVPGEEEPPPVSVSPPKSAILSSASRYGKSKSNMFPRRPATPEEDEDEEDPPAASTRPKISIGGLSRPKLSTRGGPTREPSPTRSVVSIATRYTEPAPRTTGASSSSGAEVRRSRLWQELRELQLKSQRPR